MVALEEHNLVPRTATPYAFSNAIKSATANSQAKSGAAQVPGTATGTEPPQTRASMTTAQSPLVRPLPSTSRTVEGGMSTLDAVSA